MAAAMMAFRRSSRLSIFALRAGQICVGVRVGTRGSVPPRRFVSGTPDQKMNILEKIDQRTFRLDRTENILERLDKKVSGPDGAEMGAEKLKDLENPISKVEVHIYWAGILTLVGTLAIAMPGVSYPLMYAVEDTKTKQAQLKKDLINLKDQVRVLELRNEKALAKSPPSTEAIQLTSKDTASTAGPATVPPAPP